jgi:hypothetical protein
MVRFRGFGASNRASATMYSASAPLYTSGTPVDFIPKRKAQHPGADFLNGAGKISSKHCGQVGSYGQPFENFYIDRID